MSKARKWKPSSLNRTSVRWRLILIVWCVPFDFAETSFKHFGCIKTWMSKAVSDMREYGWMEIGLTDVDVILRACLHPCSMDFVRQSLPLLRVYLSAYSVRTGIMEMIWKNQGMKRGRYTAVSSTAWKLTFVEDPSWHRR